ncbi:MAG: hypothetical protein K1X85_04890 [Ignavibacteria bacterium]|nr:hypothetical protein [Ignavibacteria bacterium]
MNFERSSFAKSGMISIVQFRTKDADSFNYISLQDAASKGGIKIEEVDEAGSVNNLKVSNLSDQYVFFSDGEILIGAKQNRVLNTSVLIEPRSVTILPVSCVEAGRWRYRSRTFAASEYYEPSAMRMKKMMNVSQSLKQGLKHRSDQSDVWRNVSEYESRKSFSSDTSNLSDVFESISHSFAKNLNDIFPEVACNGLAIFIGRDIATIEAFNSSAVYAQYFPKLLRAAYMDIDLYDSGELGEIDAVNELNKAMKKVKDAKSEEHRAVAAGKEFRYHDDKMTSYRLNYEATPVHLAALFRTT